MFYYQEAIFDYMDIVVKVLTIFMLINEALFCVTALWVINTYYYYVC